MIFRLSRPAALPPPQKFKSSGWEFYGFLQSPSSYFTVKGDLKTSAGCITISVYRSPLLNLCSHQYQERTGSDSRCLVHLSIPSWPLCGTCGATSSQAQRCPLREAVLGRQAGRQAKSTGEGPLWINICFRFREQHLAGQKLIASRSLGGLNNV